MRTVILEIKFDRLYLTWSYVCAKREETWRTGDVEECIISVHNTWSCELLAGLPRAATSADENVFVLIPRSNFQPNRKAWVSFAEWLGFGLKELVCKSTNSDVTDKDNRVCNVEGPGLPGPSNLYPLSLPLSRVGTGYHLHDPATLPYVPLMPTE